MIVSAVGHACQIQNTATKLNVDLPEPFTAALDAPTASPTTPHNTTPP
jgi:hypothetical protein